MSRGSEHDTWAGLSGKEPKRNGSEHVTVTVVLYSTVAGGVTSQEDVAAAVEDMEALYVQCAWSGHLADDGADFMKAELTVADTIKIAQKVTTQPYVPPSHRGRRRGGCVPGRQRRRRRRRRRQASGSNHVKLRVSMDSLLERVLKITEHNCLHNY